MPGIRGPVIRYHLSARADAAAAADGSIKKPRDLCCIGSKLRGGKSDTGEERKMNGAQLPSSSFFDQRCRVSLATIFLLLLLRSMIGQHLPFPSFSNGDLFCRAKIQGRA